MRLWHQDLIPKLPRPQLLGQHRECCALRGNGWGKKHATVNYVFDYSPYLLHDQAVIGIEAIGQVVKDIVDRRLLLAPAIASKGAAFPVLAQELGTRELGNQVLVPESHLLTS